MRFLKAPRSEEKERWGGSTVSNYTLWSMTKVGIISVKVTTVNVDDRKPISEMIDEIWGSLYGDKGYISGPLERELVNKGVTLITGGKKHIPN
nr:transposase [Candidatus Enterovibrio escacola]